MERYFYLQDLVDAYVDLLRGNRTDTNRMKCLNAWLQAEQAGYSRAKLDQACDNIFRVMSPNLEKVCDYCGIVLDILREVSNGVLHICPECKRTFFFRGNIQESF